jgi:hypothetical protein
MPAVVVACSLLEAKNTAVALTTIKIHHRGLLATSTVLCDYLALMSEMRSFFFLSQFKNFSVY